MDAAAEKEEGICVAIFVGEGGNLSAPAVKLRFDGIGQGVEAGDVGGDLCGVHAADALRFKEAEEEEDFQLASEALGGGDGFFNAGGEGHGDVGFAGHGGGCGVGDGENFFAATLSFAECGEGVGCFAGLGDDDDGGATKGNTAAG